MGECVAEVEFAPFAPFALVVLTMGLETGYFRFAGQAATERERKEVFETTWGAVSLFALLFFAAALLFTPALARIMDYAEHPSYIRLTAAIIALDAATAYQVTDSILSLEGMTRILVTHSLDAALLQRCDRILALRGGRIVESGTFDELMSRRGYFYSLYTVSQ